jgi:cell filamentation protein
VFREGNGRTQLTFLFLLADRAGHPLDMTRIEPQAMLTAMIESFHARFAPLECEIARLCV